MKRFKIEHTTGFKYDREVVASYNEARMLPERSDRQTVFSAALDITPRGSSHEFTDFFGSHPVMFEVLEPHRELLINAVSVVEVRPTGEADTTASWDALTVAAHSDLELTDASTQTRRTTPPSDLAKFAKKIAAEFGPHETALRVCKFIFDSVKYQHGVTGVNSIATEAWSARVGVCQDFAHLALGALRSVGIPARYVSGYLHPKLEPEIGDRAVSESHAWIEWFAGEWFGYDPTNDTAITQRHIVVGHGRDYDDVPPLRGVYSADCTSELFVSVHITRTA